MEPFPQLVPHHVRVGFEAKDERGNIVIQERFDRLRTNGGCPRETVAGAAVVGAQFGNDHMVFGRLGTPAAQQRDRDQPGGEARDAGLRSAVYQLVALGQDGLELQHLFLGRVHQGRPYRANREPGKAKAGLDQ